MHKFILVLVLTVLAVPFAASAGVPEAVAYLKVQPQDDWITQALVAAGEQNVPTGHLTSFSGSSATDYAKRILAIAAVKENPSTFASVDLVAGLKGLASAGQIGDPALLNDDAWGILALRATGVPASDPVISGAADFLLAHQNSDGGWGYAVGVPSDTNDTAAVLMALAEVGTTSADAPVASAVTYLSTQQTSDAGFVYQLPCFWPGCDAADSASTSWVVSALTKLKLNPVSWVKGSATPFDFLQSLQTGDGSFKWQAGDPAGSAGMTVYAVVALENASYPVARFTPGGSGAWTPIAEMELSASAPQVEEGGTVTYTLTLENHGPNIADRIVVRDIVPAGAAVTNFVTSDGVFDAASNTWQFVRLNNYASATLELSLIAPSGQSFATTASVSAQELDFNTTNNTAAISFTTPSPPQISSGNSGGQAPPAPEPEVLGVSVASCAVAAPATVANYRGRFVRSAADPSPTWYVGTDGAVTCLDSDASVRALFEKLALGITNSNLEKISPGGALTKRLSGRLLLQVESVGEVWYVNPGDGKLTYLPPTLAALDLVRPLAAVAP